MAGPAQLLDELRPDEAGSADDDDLHVALLFAFLTPAEHRLCTRALESANTPAWIASRETCRRLSGPFSLLKQGELVREVSDRIAVQEGSPAHPGHAQRGQLGERRRLRQA